MPIGAVPAAILDIGARFASDAIGAELGYNRQKRLQALQIRGAKELSEFNKAQQLDLWNKTNYAASVQHLKNAGLNPALMYGMGGAGGATAGAGSGSIPTGATARQTGPEIPPMALQLSLIEAQRKNIEADTKLKETTAEKQSGVDTTESQARTNKLMQELSNLQEDWNIKRLQQTLMNIENWEKQATQEDRLDYIEYQTDTALKHLNLLKNQNKISDATLQQAITIITQNAIGAQLTNELTRTKIKVDKAQIDKWASEIAQTWETININKFKAEIDANYPGVGEFLGKIFNTVTESIAERIRGKSRKIEKVD